MDEVLRQMSSGRKQSGKSFLPIGGGAVEFFCHTEQLTNNFVDMFDLNVGFCAPGVEYL